MTVVATSPCQLFWLGPYYWGEAGGECLLGAVLKLSADGVGGSGDMCRNTGLLA